MGLSLSDLCDKLTHHHPQLYLSSRSPASIQSAKFLTDHQTSFMPGFIYVGKTSSLPGLLPLQDSANLLCVADSDIPPACTQNPALNLIVLKEKVDIRNIFNEILDILKSHQKRMQYSRKLFEAVIQQKGIPHIIDIGYEMLGNPIIFGDPSTKLLAHSKSEKMHETGWDEHIKNGYLSYDRLHSLEFKKMREEIMKSKTPILRRGLDKCDFISANVTIHGVIVGHLNVLGLEKQISESDLDLVALLCDVISAEMQKDEFYKNTKGAMYENFIRDLLDGSINDSNVIEKRAVSLDLNLEETFYIISINVKHFDTSRSALAFLRNSLECIISFSKSIIYDDYIVLLVNCNTMNTSYERDLSSLNEFLLNNKLNAGVSRNFNALKNIRHYFRQSVKSIELGVRSKEKRGIFFYEDYTLNHLMEMCSGYQNLKSLCHPSLFKLMEYDSKFKTAYTQTLYIYLLNQGNLNTSANMLHIHLSSFNYRIKKIEELLNIKLNDTYNMHYLYFSINLLKQMDAPELLKS